MITPTESCSGEARWNTFPNASGEGLPPIGCAMRTEVTKWERNLHIIRRMAIPVCACLAYVPWPIAAQGVCHDMSAAGESRRGIRSPSVGRPTETRLGWGLLHRRRALRTGPTLALPEGGEREEAVETTSRRLD